MVFVNPSWQVLADTCKYLGAPHIPPPRRHVLLYGDQQGMSGLSAHDSAYIHCVMTAPKSKSKARPVKSEAPPEPRALTHPEIRTIVLGIMLAMFLGALDQTIVATALPTIGRHFGNLDDLSWVVTAYLLTGTAVTPLYGKLADIHGRRVMMLTAIGIFVVGSVACALAQTIIADIVSPLERGRYQGYIGAVFAASSIGGPVLGGFLTEHVDWSLIFWINLPLGL